MGSFRRGVASIAVWALALAAGGVAHVRAAPEPDVANADTDETLWPDRSHVTVDELYAALTEVADEAGKSDAVRADYDALVAAHGLADSEALYRDYVRLKIAFEATRDGGWWHLSWKITNQKPNSEQIWRQWRRAAVPDAARPAATAVAECDELSALFAFSARRMGVKGIGLYWPVWNHVVAVWSPQSQDGTRVRIVVPTSQIFLGTDDSLGTEGFDPWTQKTIYEYRRRDAKGRQRVDAALARFFVTQAHANAHKSQVELQTERNARDARLLAANPGHK